MTAPTSLAETLAAVVCFKLIGKSDQGDEVCEGCADDGDALAVAARAWLVARLNEHGPPEVLVGALTNMIEAASQARDDCHDDLRRSWHQGRVSALMDAKRQTESWVAALTEVLTDD